MSTFENKIIIFSHKLFHNKNKLKNNKNNNSNFLCISANKYFPKERAKNAKGNKNSNFKNHSQFSKQNHHFFAQIPSKLCLSVSFCNSFISVFFAIHFCFFFIHSFLFVSFFVCFSLPPRTAGPLVGAGAAVLGAAVFGADVFN